MRLNEYIKFIRGVDSGTVRGIEADEKLHNVVSRLANLGWALPANLTLEQIEKLAEVQYTNENIDELLIEFYSKDDCAQLESLIKEAKSPVHLVLFSELLDEALDSYKDGRYRICVPALITIVEGVLSKKLGVCETKQTRFIAPTKQKIEDVQMNLTKTFWTSIHMLISSLYKKSNFYEKMPKELNRHWVLHGRATLGESKKSALQLFVLISTISAA